jgi:hypothetical protein
MLLSSPPPGFAPDRCFFVALKGGDVDNIADAITKVNGLSPVPSATAPAAIVVFPGIYSTPPFTLPAHVTLMGLTGERATILEASTTTSALCTAPGPNTLQGLTLEDANGIGGIGVEVSGTGNVILEQVIIDNCETGVWCVGTSYSAELHHTTVSNCTDGYLFNGVGARGRVNDAVAELCTNGLRIGSTGGIITGQGYRAVDDASFTRHIWVEASAGILALVNSVFREDKGFYHTSAEIAVAHASIVPGDEAYQFTAELHVGSEDRPRESCFGGGDSHTRGLAGLTNTNLEVGTWNDITAGIKDDDGSSVALFAGTGIGNAFYIGGDQPFPGIKPEITTALSGGSLILEYWNGASWVAIPHLSSDANTPYDQYAQLVFQRVNTEQVRFGEITGWTTKTLNTITKYWVRFRVATAITTAPQADRIKIHTNRTEINSDGVVEYFGAAEPIRPLIWHRSLLEELEGFAQPDVAIDIASGFSIKALANRWQDGNKDGSASFVSALPGLDTSRPLIYEVGWAPEATGAGNVEVQLDVVTVNPGDVLDGTLAYTQQLAQIVTGPFTAFTLQVTQFEISVPDLEAIGSLAIALYRDAGGGNLDDTFAGNAMHVYSNLYGTFWR